MLLLLEMVVVVEQTILEEEMQLMEVIPHLILVVLDLSHS
jgi:hypothetical protein